MLCLQSENVKKIMLHATNRDAAGEREGGRPTSQYNNPPQKSLSNKLFGRSSILQNAKCLADEAQSKKSIRLF